MSRADELRRENRALRDRFARLGSAVLRISLSLDPAAVLQGRSSAAHALTGAGKSVITMIDGEGRLRNFVASGLTPEQRRETVGRSDGAWPSGHLRELPAPIRPEDFPGYLRSPGLSDPARPKTPAASRRTTGAGLPAISSRATRRPAHEPVSRRGSSPPRMPARRSRPNPSSRHPHGRCPVARPGRREGPGCPEAGVPEVGLRAVGPHRPHCDASGSPVLTSTSSPGA